jgi:prephenate dehydrogenase
MNPIPTQIIGTGLIGTSIALRIAELGWPVELIDNSTGALQIATDLVPSAKKIDHPELVIIATTPKSLSSAAIAALQANPLATVIDVGSVKNKVQVEVERFPDLSKRFVGTHPIAGRESSGPSASRSDLFLGRAWILTPSNQVEAERVNLVKAFISEMGAAPYEMSTKLHDAFFAKISHLPQLLSVTLASSISDLGPEISLAGQGLRDMLRLAASDGRLWSEIFEENREEVLSSIDDFQELLDVLREAIEENAAEKIAEFFLDASQIPARIGGKHGARPREYSHVDIVIDDRPGQLAAIFDECGNIQVNIEDLALEHSPKQETGLIRLALSKGDAKKLYDHLRNKGWKVHQQ